MCLYLAFLLFTLVGPLMGFESRTMTPRPNLRYLCPQKHGVRSMAHWIMTAGGHEQLGNHVHKPSCGEHVKN